VVSDAHVGLKNAIVAALAGASWQRCRVHFMRNILSHVGREAQHLVGAAVRSIFNEPDQASAHRRLQEVAEKLAPRFPRVRDLLLEAAEDVLAYMAFPRCTGGDYSTNPLGAPTQRAQASHRRGGHLPHPKGGNPANRGPVGRAERRVGDGPTILQPGIDEEAPVGSVAVPGVTPLH
jgi:transposase-like protein